MRFLAMVVVVMAAGFHPAGAHAQAVPPTATAATPPRGPVVIRKTDVIYGRVQGARAFISRLATGTK